MANLAFTKKEKTINFARYTSDELLMPGYICFFIGSFSILLLLRVHTYLTFILVIASWSFKCRIQILFSSFLRCKCAGLSELLQITLV
ncbi:uncharacterized protein ASPGLDRAFT_1076331 [Aspergillus glaucus CBS 516.65]|uniref:Uncharacterized protein n=1 Tax=Aspergillus glaucus CBS 516.65 TaxID=1160497 RepID=A0A1L9V536_ASPGL|nr:hypothetical protein ASPGLDRAFT_1076331 [Aspergillus glaucus CBS 516.65]OJJ79027.1 hypothetical protein ASPGLDRAFT_1076331 [Aspergillus glaucus CBS 516.65]